MNNNEVCEKLRMFVPIPCTTFVNQQYQCIPKGPDWTFSFPALLADAVLKSESLKILEADHSTASKTIYHISTLLITEVYSIYLLFRSAAAVHVQPGVGYQLNL